MPATSRSTTSADRHGPGAPPLRVRPADRALRVLLVSEAAGGGVGRHVLDLAQGLLTAGHRVDVAWSPGRAEPGFIKALDAIAGLPCHRLHMSRAPGPGDIRAVLALRRLMGRAGPFDLVHGHSSKAGALVRLAAAGLGIPALYTPHAFVTLDPDLGALPRAVYALAERLLSAWGARLICVSEEERAHALSLGIRANRLAVIANGIAPLPPADRPAARARMGLPEATPCVGFVGRLSAQKAVDRLLRAFALAPGNQQARLVIVGEGAEQAALESLARDLGIADRTRFTGQADGVALMAGFDIFALPSRYEGFPYVLPEAACRGLPILTMAVGGAGVVVEEGGNGFIVPQAGGAAALAERLGLLLGDPGLRRAMAKRSLERAAGLTAQNMVANTVALYREVLGGR